MVHDSTLSLFLFPSMPPSDRRLVLDLGELLTMTDGRYRDHLETSIRLLQDAARAEGLSVGPRGVCRCRVLPFRRLS